MSVSPPVPTRGETRRSATPPSSVDGPTIVCSGTWLKTAHIFDEIWREENVAVSPAALIARVRAVSPTADLFTFGQKPSDIVPAHAYHLNLDSLAVANTDDVTRWWNALPHESRKNVRKAQKRGVVVRPVELTDELAAGIKLLYDETPVRQGRRFVHFGKDLATVKRENSSYLDRSQFIGAFLDAQLIGFLKMVQVGDSARIMQILASEAHYDKHPTNALLSAAMELCSKRSVARLIYGQYVYGRKRNSSVTEFKRRNGFHEILVPRYYVPLTMKGRLAIAAGVHRGFAGLVPEPLLNVALKARSLAFRRLSRRPPPRVAAATT